MTDFGKDWPVYFALLGFVSMVVFAIVQSKKKEKEERTATKDKSNARPGGR